MLQVPHGEDGQEEAEGCPLPGLGSPQHPPSCGWDPLSFTQLGGGTPHPFSSTHGGGGPPYAAFTQASMDDRLGGVMELPQPHGCSHTPLWFPRGQASGRSSTEICGQLKLPEVATLMRCRHGALQIGLAVVAAERPAGQRPPPPLSLRWSPGLGLEQEGQNGKLDTA